MTTASTTTTSPLRLVGADIDVVADRPLVDLERDLTAATHGSAFSVQAVEAMGDGRARVRFTADVMVGWGTVLDLQHRLVRVVEVTAVERRTAADLATA